MIQTGLGLAQRISKINEHINLNPIYDGTMLTKISSAFHRISGGHPPRPAQDALLVHQPPALLRVCLFLSSLLLVCSLRVFESVFPSFGFLGPCSPPMELVLYIVRGFITPLVWLLLLKI